jgi:hypothetical protein
MAIRSRWLVGGFVTVSVAALWILVAGSERSEGYDGAPPAAARPSSPIVSPELRDRALKRATIWQPTDVASFDFSANPPDPSGALSESIVRCRYLPEAADGTAPKFDCVLRNGEVVKVKYGPSGERFAEIAASRLLTALGFGADRMYWVPRVRCEGCPPFPFHTAWLLDRLHARAAIAPHLSSDRPTDFEWVAVERKHEGETIKSQEDKGWAWYELDQIEPRPGATRAEVDALRLAAILLAHWDNKSSNQRLVCLDPQPLSTTRPCARALAMIQDLGATFGPKRVELENWMATSVWKDPRRCTVSMRQLPYDGGTFPDTQISEGGRQLITRQLSALTDGQIVALFSGARFSEFTGGRGAEADPNVWAQRFRDKVQEIVQAGPCPS